MSRPSHARTRYVTDLVLGGLLLGGLLAIAIWADDPAVTHLGLALAGLTAGVGALSVVRRDYITRRTPGALLFAGAFSWTVCELVEATRLFAGASVRAPSIADAGHFAAEAFVIASLLTMVGVRRGLLSVISAVLDGLLIAGSLLAASWVLVIGPAHRAEDDGGLLQLAVVGYPLIALLTGTIASYAVLAGRRGRRVSLPSLVTISVGALMLAVSDSSWAALLALDTEVPTARVLLGWYLSLFAFLAAARHPRAGTASTRARLLGDEVARPGALGAMLPFLSLLVAVGFGVADVVRAGQASAFVTGLGAALLVVCVARMLVFVVESDRFTTGLEERVAARSAEVQVREERFRALIANASDVTTVITVDGMIGYQSPAVARLLGRGPEELVGRTVASLVHSQDVARFFALLDRLRDEPHTPLVAELRMSHRDGGFRITETTMTNLLREPSVRGVVLNSRDITERRQLERALEHQATHDPLTGLANRAQFHERLEQAIRDRRSDAGLLGVMVIGLADLNAVNDERGHDQGDAVLRAVAVRLRTEAGEQSVVARLGGEFGVLLRDVDSRDDLTTTVEWLLQVARSVEVDGRPVDLVVTAGAAIARTGDDADDLLRDAEVAMHRARAAKGGGWAFYDPILHSGVELYRGLEKDLEGAVERDELVLHYQPTVELTTGRIVGVEALVQWAHPTRGLLAPMTFIPMAEESGLIGEIGAWILQEACNQGAQWQRSYGSAGETPLEVYVNLSGRQLQDSSLARSVAWQVNASEVEPSSLVLELSESLLVEDDAAMMDLLVTLRAMGVRLAIDDFGTGYTSLAFLHRLPADVLKIDRSFVEALGRDGDEEAAQEARTIIQLGRSLGMQTVAEGVETRDQVRALVESRCQHGQGFLFHRPMPAEDVERALATQFALGAADEPAFTR
ncbi:MAG TPA: EAL domain-containing protein [Mycobacteriales bacterium]|nr:EAL domain-containing protein [Mycobacteriales bacterium]